jgi:hypothetical protein
LVIIMLNIKLKGWQLINSLFNQSNKERKRNSLIHCLTVTVSHSLAKTFVNWSPHAVFLHLTLKSLITIYVTINVPTYYTSNILIHLYSVKEK